MPASPKDKPLSQTNDVDVPESTKQAEEREDEQVPVSPERGDEKETPSDAAGERENSNKDQDESEQPEDASKPTASRRTVPSQTEWQAIWSPQHNAYYFFNSRTSETTWVNPLDPSATASTASTSAEPTDAQPTSESKPEETSTGEKPPPDLSYLNGIDPELAYLDPTLAVPSGGSKGPVPTFSARFGARDGRFTAMDGRRPEHLSEAARAQRMSSVYYDTEAWEREIAERDAKAKAEAEAGVGDKRKRVTKADIERFKEQKKAKKAMRNAWLRE
ncbi:WW domain protein [Rhizoctonia solani]|uniref:WW domain protein n=1 Tax=Rhizoctonia solani TaxID=456999 RepID=A0A8H8T133_9AGAM|nr:WW domain protein [Rhizoctonia solani]QRW26021.1 WW domain protein [Rhizoctonia solani]